MLHSQLEAGQLGHERLEARDGEKRGAENSEESEARRGVKGEQVKEEETRKEGSTVSTEKAA